METRSPRSAIGRRPERGLDAQRRVASLGHVLGVWAHPDDETYLGGGLLALAAANGQRTTCVTATAGEHGTADAERWPPDRLAAERRAELERALAVLDVDEHHWLGVEDGTCDAIDLADGVAAIRRILRHARPDTLITFGADGVTGHPDHRTVGWWASLAAMAEGGIRVLHAAKATTWTTEFAGLHARARIAEPGHPVPTPDRELVVDLELDGEALDRKVAALLLQRTQTEPLIDLIGGSEWERWIRRESFRRARGLPWC